MTTIQVKVKPSSRVSTLQRGSDGVWLALLKSPPVDGKANAELVALIADQFGCRKVDVTDAGRAAGDRGCVLRLQRAAAREARRLAG